MSPEEVKMSKLSAEVTLAEIGTTAERIRILTAHVPRHAPVKINDREVRRIRGRPLQKKALPPMNCDPKPTTWEGYCEAARKAVRLHQKGETRARACQRAGITESLSTGISHCVDKSFLFRTIKSGAKPPREAPRHQVSFIRWFLGITCPSRIHGDDTEQLRTRLSAGGYSLLGLSQASGVHPTTIQKFRNGNVRGMRPETRAKLWEALK